MRGSHERNCKKKRPYDRPDLVHGFIEAETEPRADLFGGLGEERVFGRAPDGFSDALHHDQECCDLPEAGERQERNTDKQGITQDREEPIGLRFV